MANVQGAYCATTDLRVGDLPDPSYATRDQYIQGAAEEIEIALGNIYVTPFVIPELPENRTTILTLKKLNWLLASGRFITDVTTAGEEDSIHAYGWSMINEALAMLKGLVTGEPFLTGAEKLPSNSEDGDFTGPVIHNEDSVSLVEQFYTQRRPYIGLGESLPGIIYPNPVTPYG